MFKLVSSTLWPQIELLATNSKRKLAAVAYVSNDNRVKFGKGDVLIVDASDERISSGDTSKEFISKAFKKGVRIYSLPNLHAKVFVFDETLVLGSSNISASSQRRLHEVGIITDEPTLVKSAKNLIDQFRLKAHKVNQSFVERIQSIPTRDTSGVGGGKSVSSKPSLLELLISNNHLLDDFAIILYENDPTLNNREIRKEAKNSEVRLPPNDKWTWYENDIDSETVSACNHFFKQKELKAISFHVTSDEDQIEKFHSVDRVIQIYVNHFRIRRRLVVNFIDDTRAPFKFSEKELIRVLNRSLKCNPKAGARLFNKPAWILTAKEFSQLLGFR